MEENRITLGSYLKDYFKQCLNVFKHPKLLLPTAILTVIWIGLGILQNHVGRNLPLSVLNFFTFAQGGLYGGIIGAIGGIFGKIVVAACVNALIVPLFQKKNPFANFKQGFKDIFTSIKFESKDATSLLLKGFGTALLLYSIFNLTQSFENSLVAIVSVVALISATARKGGFLWGLVFSFMNTVSKRKIPTYQRLMRVLTGMTLGFTLGILFSAVGFRIVGLLGLIALIVGWIMGRGTKKEAVATTILILLFLLPKAELWAAGRGASSKEVEPVESGCWRLVKVVELDESNKLSSSSNYHLSVTGSKGQFTVRAIAEDVFDIESCKQVSYDVSRSFTMEQPPKAYYPGDIVELSVECSAQSGGAPDLMTYCQVAFILYSHYSKEFFDPNNPRLVHGNAHDFIGYKNYGPITTSYKYEYSLPVPGTRIFFDKFCIMESVAGLKGTLYYYEWDANGKAGNNSNSTDSKWSDRKITFPKWIEKLFGTDGEHTSDVITILIGVLGVLGGLGGGLGGTVGGGDVPGGNGPGGEGPAGGGPEPEPKPEPTPEELEWERYQKEKEDRFRKYTHDNPDGTKTYIDPATGEKHTLYPKYNTETGEFTHWVNENDSTYDEAKLNDWLAWRERNSEHFAQNETEAQQNLAEQRAMNQAQNDYDRERHSSSTADAHKAFKEQSEKELADIMRVRDMIWKRGVADQTELKRVLKQDMHEAFEEHAEQMEKAAFWNDVTNATEIVENTSDKLINILGETSPAARQIKNYYTFAKSTLKHGAQGFAKGQGIGGFAAEVGVGIVEGGLGVFQNEEMTSVVGGTFVGGMVKSGMNVGAEMAKSAWNDLLDPNKTPQDLVDDLYSAAINRAGYELIGKFTGWAGGKASDATKFGVNTATAFSQEMGFQNPALNELTEYVNMKRQGV